MIRRLAAAAAFLVLAAIGCVWLRPFQTAVALRKAALAAGGARRVRAGTLAAYERDLCDAGKPCRCVAFVHGLGDSAMTWDRLLLGTKGAAAPASGSRLLAVELPGSEGSDPPAAPEGYAIPAMADAVRGALEPACPRWTVVGNSLGGWVAATLALRWPQGVEKLVLVNAAGLDDPTGQAEATARVLESPTPETMKTFAERAYHHHESVPDRAWAAVADSIRARPTARIVAALRREDLLDASAKAIRAPTLVVWGASDRALPRSIGEGYARLIPGAKLELIPDCGHLPQQECPAALSRLLAP